MATVCRYAGLDENPPNVLDRSVVIDAPQARALAATLNSAPKGHGPYQGCYQGDGATDIVYFVVPPAGISTVIVQLTGCQNVEDAQTQLDLDPTALAALNALVGPDPQFSEFAQKVQPLAS